jgi:ATP-binding cassette subfamily F protein 3
MRILAGVDRPDQGQRTVGHRVMIEYFAQNQSEVLDSGKTVYEEMYSGSPTTMVPLIREILGGFLFSGDDVYKKVGVLSGGERNRLAIARMLLKPSNVLLLDEPTNHLDLDSKEILLDSLLDYGGTLVFVSHDRYFIDRLANKIVDVGSGQALLYPGGYEDFIIGRKRGVVPLPPSSPVQTTRKENARITQPPTTPKSLSTSSTKPSSRKRASRGRKAAPPPRDPLAPRLRPKNAPPDRHAHERELRRLKTRLVTIEGQITAQEAAVREVEQQMASPGFYADAARSAQAVARHKSLHDELSALMKEWESLQEAVDRTQKSPAS